MSSLNTALKIINNCGEQAKDWDKWAQTDLHDFLVALVMTYTPAAMVEAMIEHYETHIGVQDDLLKDYDPVTGLDEYGENNKGDLLEKKYCEAKLQLLKQFMELYQKQDDERDK